MGVEHRQVDPLTREPTMVCNTFKWGYSIKYSGNYKKMHIKTKKILITNVNKKRADLLEYSMNNYRIYYNDLLALFKASQKGYKDWKNYYISGETDIDTQRDLSLYNINKCLSENFKFSDNLTPEDAFKFVNSGSYQALTYINKYSNHHLCSASKAFVCEQFSKAISSFWKNIKQASKEAKKDKKNKKSKKTTIDLKYKSITKTNFLGFRVKVKIVNGFLIFPVVDPTRKVKRGFNVRLKLKNSGVYFDSSKHPIKTVSIVKEGNRYFACIVTQEESSKTGVVEKCVGVDWGVVRLATLSDGTVYDALPEFRREQQKKRLAIKISKSKKGSQKMGSNNRKKSVLKYGKLCRARSDFRKTYIEQVTCKIAKNSVVGVEDLEISNMTKSAKGTVETPGKNVKQKSGLNKAILNHSPYYFKMRLAQKVKQNGGQFIEIDPKNTSRTCPNCSYVDKDNRLTQANFKCLSCGYEDNADLVAAKNIEKLTIDNMK